MTHFDRFKCSIFVAVIAALFSFFSMPDADWRIIVGFALLGYVFGCVLIAAILKLAEEKK